MSVILNPLGGLTQVQLFMLLILYRGSDRQGREQKVKDTLEWRMESEQMLKLLAMSP